MLAVIAAIFLPLAFMIGLFGVNVAGIPGSTDPDACAIFTATLFGLGNLGYLVLRWRKWV
ncbi:CorA family divalent cation transporter [Yoonia sp.]|uniref:CorA family divalent cation transporter n=1 Tax=Yoonia sp. TaxID=2212373 RepID=UPI0019F34B0F|nr:CorA family divalent cation transporter [Yoonia sp.]MBE0414592.1 hypothetical protein [Yoonia sp.]